MRDGFVSHTATGALGGALGTLFLTRGMRMSRRLPERIKPPPVRRDPGDFLIKKVEELRGRPLPRGVHDSLAEGLHWAYGIAWGAALGLTTSSVQIKSARDAALAGTAMGTAVWATGYVVGLPAMRLTPPVHRQGLMHVATSLVAHIAFGIVATLPILAYDKVQTKRRRRLPSWLRAIERRLR